MSFPSNALDEPFSKIILIVYRTPALSNCMCDEPPLTVMSSLWQVSLLLCKPLVYHLLFAIQKVDSCVTISYLRFFSKIHPNLCYQFVIGRQHFWYPMRRDHFETQFILINLFIIIIIMQSNGDSLINEYHILNYNFLWQRRFLVVQHLVHVWRTLFRI